MKQRSNPPAEAMPSPALRRLADRLTGLKGLGEPIYLRLDKRNSQLVACAPEGRVAPPLSIRLEGGHCASCRALLSRTPILALREDRDCDPLDQRLAGEMDGVLALPLAQDGELEVLLVSGRRAALEALRDAPGEPPSPPLRREAPPTQARMRRAVEEFSDPVGIIKNYLAMLEQRGEAAEELRVIRGELDRITRIARALAWEDAPLPAALREETDLGQLVDDLLRVGVHLGQGSDARLRHHGLPDAPRPRLDRDRVKQLLLLLFPRILEATPAGAETLIESGRTIRRDQRDFVELRVSLNTGGEGDAERQTLHPDYARIGVLAQDMNGEFFIDRGESGPGLHVLFPL